MISGVKIYKPRTAGRRGMSRQDFSMLTAKRNIKSLVEGKPGKSGRNVQGKITIRHRSTGGVKKMWRKLSKYAQLRGSLEIMSIEYDPNRTARIATVKDHDGKSHYILATKDIKVGDKLEYGENAKITPGNVLALKNIPVGVEIHSIELKPGQGAKLARSAGTTAIMQGIDQHKATIKLGSGETKILEELCQATVGQVSNAQHNKIRIGKAGRNRLLGKRPTVRGKAMHPGAHPHGGGEGGSPIGLRGGPKTKWGAKALGVKTRNKKKQKLIK